MSKTFLYKLKIAIAIPASKWGKRLREILVADAPRPSEKEMLRTKLLRLRRHAIREYGEGIIKGRQDGSPQRDQGR